MAVWLCDDRVGADITVLREREVDYDSDMPRKITEVLVRKVPDNQQVSTHPSLSLTPTLPGGPLVAGCSLAREPGGVQVIIWSPGSVTALNSTIHGAM